MNRKALIFCASSVDIDPDFNTAARDLVKALAAKGYDVVSGGTIKGTMKVVADAAHEAGTGNIGIVPRFMEPLVHPHLTTTVWTDTMSERKEKMREGTSVAIALPGGIGTMDELFETFTLAKLEKYSGKVIVLNVKGFYDSLEELVDYFVETGMLDGKSRQLISFPKSVEELTQLI